MEQHFPIPTGLMGLLDRDPAEKTERLREYYEGELAKIQDFITQHPSPHAWIPENELLSQFYGEICVAYWNQEMQDELLAEIIAYQPRLVSNNGISDYHD